MFYNVVFPKDRAFSIERTGHVLFGSEEGTGGIGFNQSLPLFLLFLAVLFGNLLMPIFKPIIKMITSPVIDEDIKEGLENYYSAIAAKEKEVWVTEENYNRQKLGFKGLTDDAFQRLQSAK